MRVKLNVLVSTAAIMLCADMLQAAVIDDTEMVSIPAGEFIMGCDAADPLCLPAASPSHKVYLDAYRIDTYEVTFRRYNQCVQSGQCSELYMGGGCNAGLPWNANHPANCVDYKQADTFCAWEDKRLPTEAEWEKAARGQYPAAEYRFPWGNEPASCERAVMNKSTAAGVMGPGCGAGTTQPVGSKPKGASPYGVMDMAGNLYEWTSDWYSETYFSKSPAKNPQGPNSGAHKTLRSSSWLMRTDDGIATNVRSGYSPLGQGYVVGFRCVAD